MSIDSIIKQAMIDAGMNPVVEKKATGNKLADDLYALAAECEKLGSARVGVAKSAEQSCLRDLTKAYLFQRMLKSAVEDRLGVVDTEFEKSAGEHESDIRYEYIEAFEKLAAEGEEHEASRWDMVERGAGRGAIRGTAIGAGIGVAPGAVGGSMLAKLLQQHNILPSSVGRGRLAVLGAISGLGLGSSLGTILGAQAGAAHGALRNKDKYNEGKSAAEKSAIDMKTLAKAVGAGLGMAGVGYGGYKLVEREGRIGRELADAPEHKGLVEAVKGMDNALLDYNVRHGRIRNNTPWYPKKQVGDKQS